MIVIQMYYYQKKIKIFKQEKYPLEKKEFKEWIESKEKVIISKIKMIIKNKINKVKKIIKI